MLYRKMTTVIENQLQSQAGSILVIDGVPGTGRRTLVRNAGQKFFKHYIEINFKEDKQTKRNLFSGIGKTDAFYQALETYYKKPLSLRNDTLVVFEEIETYPKIVNLLKNLVKENRFTYVIIGTGLRQSETLPKDLLRFVTIRPMDFTEYLMANGIQKSTLETMYENFRLRLSLNEEMHARVLQMFNDYLFVGGMPGVVDAFLKNKDIDEVRRLQHDVREFYGRNMNRDGVYAPIVFDMTYPLHSEESTETKLYFNDVGMMTSVMEFSDFREPDYEDITFATFINTEAVSHGVQLYNYRDSDILLFNDKNTNSVVSLIPDCSYTDAAQMLEVVKTIDNIQNIYVLSTQREIRKEGNVTYIPVYDVMFLFRNC